MNDGNKFFTPLTIVLLMIILIGLIIGELGCLSWSNQCVSIGVSFHCQILFVVIGIVVMMLCLSLILNIMPYVFSDDKGESN